MVGFFSDRRGDVEDLEDIMELEEETVKSSKSSVSITEVSSDTKQKQGEWRWLLLHAFCSIQSVSFVHYVKST